ncbi:MAG: hypothetical protein INR69_23120 [Mucilaginibacter polytrichastri]|nr:hypothetical protein [Mucilaginibacter polytrichastri]
MQPKNTPQKEQADSVLLSETATHRFSDSVQVDTFRIDVTGDDLTKGRAHFVITRFDGKVIFQQFFPVQKLLGNQVVPLDNKRRMISDSERLGILTTRLHAFFDPKNFLVPAIPASYKERGITDRTFWEDLKLDAASVGFMYTFGDDNRTWIAYDRQSGMVRIYYNCC